MLWSSMYQFIAAAEIYKIWIAVTTHTCSILSIDWSLRLYSSGQYHRVGRKQR